MAEEDLDYGEKEDTWSLFVKLTQWGSVIVILLFKDIKFIL